MCSEYHSLYYNFYELKSKEKGNTLISPEKASDTNTEIKEGLKRLTSLILSLLKLVRKDPKWFGFQKCLTSC